MKIKTIIPIVAFCLLFSGVVLAQGLWYPDTCTGGECLRPVDDSWGIMVGSSTYASCGKLYTDASNTILCGTDAIGGEGGAWATSVGMVYTTDIVLIGDSATTSGGYAFEVIGNSLMDGITVTGLTIGTYTGFLKTNAGVVGTSTIGATDLTSADFGGFTCNGSTCSVDSDGTWTGHNSYPTACSGNNWVQGIGDTLTCNQIGFSNLSGSATDDQIPDNITITDNATTGVTTLSSLVSIGTITTGVWNGTAIANTKGGTGKDSSGWTGLAYITGGTWGTTTESDPQVGTLTAGQWCYATSTYIDCTLDAPAGSGDVTAVGDCADGDCFDGTSDGGTYLNFYDAQGIGRLITGNLTDAHTWTLPDATGTIITSGNLTDITTVGTIGTGVWNGTAIDISSFTNLVAGRSLTMSGDSVELDAEIYSKDISISIYNASDTMDAIVQKSFSYPITITKIECSTSNTSSSTIQFDERAYATPNTAGVDVMTTALICISTSASTTSFANAGIAAEAPLSLDIDTITGTVASLRIHIFYTIDD